MFVMRLLLPPALLLLLAAPHGGRAAPDITMSIRDGSVVSGAGTADGQPSFTVNQVHNILSSIDFKLRDLSNTFRRDQQTERINVRIDTMFNKLSHLEVSNGMWFDKFQQSVIEECGPNHMTRRLDKAQLQLEITLEHMETTLQSVQNHQKELEKEIKKVADRQTELSADVQTMRKDVSTEFDKHNSSQSVFRKQLQEIVTNITQQLKNSDRSLSTCSCNQNDDPSQYLDLATTNKLTTMINGMHNELKERSDNTHVLLKELIEITEKYRRRLDSDRQDIISEFLDNFLEATVSEIAIIQKKSENELESKVKDHLQLIVDKQNSFMNNCHRLQSNERQIENEIVLILERIFNYMDNKSLSEETTLEQISKNLKTQRLQEEKMFEELSEFGKSQTNQLARTVAYSTNQVTKLHKAVMEMSNILQTSGGSACNVITNTTSVGRQLQEGSNPNRSSAVKNKISVTAPTTATSQKDKSNGVPGGKSASNENGTSPTDDQ